MFLNANKCYGVSQLAVIAPPTPDKLGGPGRLKLMVRQHQN